MRDIAIRPAEAEDSAELARLISQLGYETSADEMRVRLAELLPHPDHLTNVAVIGGRAVGMIGAGMAFYYEKNGRYGRILALIVDERFRGRGVGSALVREIERQLAERDIRSVIVNSGSHRADAHRFYTRMGYAETGVRFVRSL